MAEATVSTQRPVGSGSLALLTSAQTEQALVAAIEKYEKAESSLELGEALGKLAHLKQEKGNFSEAEELFRRVLSLREQALGGEHIELVEPLRNLAAVRILGGLPQSADPLLNRALAITTRYLGEDHPDLTIMINDFARLYLNQGAYSLADPLLQRLLTIKRAKGDDHPEVATVVASIAAVRQAAGQNEAAEELWRRVLAIRERTLFPNHFTQATAVEHLAEVCMARGKAGEALQLFQRARSIREQTLGSSHPSLTRLRERIADLQLQAAEDSFESSEVYGGNQPLAYRLGSQQISDVGRSGSPFDPPGVGREGNYRSPEPRFSTPLSMPALDPVLATPEEREAASAAYRVSLFEREDTDLDPEDPNGVAKQLLNSASLLARRHRRELLAVVGIFAFFVIAFAAGSRVSTENDQIPEVPLHAAPPGRLSSAFQAGPAPLAVASDPIKPVILDVPSIGKKSSASHSRSEQRVSEKETDKKAEQPIIVVPVVPTNMNVFDSLARAAQSRVGTIGDMAVAVPAFGQPGQSHARFGATEPTEPAPSRARLIGTLPNPRSPTQLPAANGEVVVHFTVDTNGSPVMSSFTAVQSGHPLLTEAVRTVIAGLRFEPARDGGSHSKAVTDQVEIRYVFRPKD